MPSPSEEKYLTCQQAGKCGVTHKPVHPSTVFRWIKCGTGGVRLRAVKVGRTLCTTKAWMREFFEAAAAVELSGATPPSTPATDPKKSAKLEKELRAAGAL